MSVRLVVAAVALVVAGGFAIGAAPAWGASTTLYNVSYDPTRELYQALDAAFSADYKKRTGDDVAVKVSNGGSGKQARAVLDGGRADVVSLALAPDIDMLAAKGHLLPANWQTRLPDHSAPYTSTIVFLVRKGNPKGIHDWPDLIRRGVAVITPDPKSSGGARWNYLAAWGWALKTNNNDEAKAKAYVAALYKHVPILDSGARGATITFTERAQGDVLLAWENEALLAVREFGADKYEIVYPSISILAEPPVAVVDEHAKKDGVGKVAEDYLKFLYTPEAQEIIAQHGYRPRDKDVAAKFINKFPKIDLFTVDDVFGGWEKAQAKHFADGGTFDQIFQQGQ